MPEAEDRPLPPPEYRDPIDRSLDYFDHEKELGPEKPVVDPPPPVAEMKFWTDTLGRQYPLDAYGNIIRNTTKPFGVPTPMWSAASAK